MKMTRDLLGKFETLPYFTFEGLRQAAGISSPHHARVLLHRWAKAGHILPLKKGVYMTRRFYERRRSDVLFSAAISAILLPQSYLSLEYILQQHNLLTEITYPVTCVTFKNTRRIINTLGVFWYRHLRSDLYRGFEMLEYYGIPIARASVAKALFDYLYLRPVPPALRTSTVNLAEEWRLNLEELSDTDWQSFAQFVEASASRKMNDILNNFRCHGWLR